MNWATDFSNRLTEWVRLRQQVSELPPEPALFAINQWWFGVPWCPYYLHWDDRRDWPDPWQLISENYYCDLAKALGIVYTMYFTRHGKDLHTEIRVYNEPYTKYMYNLVFFNKGKYVLNFRDGDIVNIEQLNKTLVLQHCYTEEELKLQKY